MNECNIFSSFIRVIFLVLLSVFSGFGFSEPSCLFFCFSSRIFGILFFFGHSDTDTRFVRAVTRNEITEDSTPINDVLSLLFFYVS